MAGIAVLGTALTTHAAHPIGLFVGNVDVIDDPTSANRYGVPYDSVHVTEQGPNGVSSMTFSIDDPLMLITVSVGMEVRFQRFPGTDDYPCDFLGYVQSFSISPAFGMQGRSVEVEAVGVEALLDWAVITADVVIPAGQVYYTSVQALVAQSVGANGLRASVDPGLAASPNDVNGLSTSAFSTQPALGVTITAGTSLREGIRQVVANLSKVGGQFDGNTTVTFFRVLRMWNGTDSGYNGMTINDTTGVDAYAEALDYDVDASGVVRGVYLQGTGFAQLLMDGSGLPGPISYLSDDKADTAAKVTASAQTYLDDFAVGTRGSFRLEDRDPDSLPTSGVHPGSFLSIIDTRIPLDTSAVADRLIIGTIDKTYHGVDSSTRSQTWVISFGGMPPSLVNAMRRLTRTQRN